MIKIIKLFSIFFIGINMINFAFAENIFFEEGKKKYEEKKIQRIKIFISKKHSF